MKRSHFEKNLKKNQKILKNSQKPKKNKQTIVIAFIKRKERNS